MPYAVGHCFSVALRSIDISVQASIILYNLHKSYKVEVSE